MTADVKKPLTAAENYMSTLLDCGVKYVFANGGTDFAPIIEGLVRMRSEGIPSPDFITVPHENVATAMAMGYSKVTGEASCVMVHVNVGTANTICAMMAASRDNVPVMLAAGRTPILESGHAGSRNVPIHWAQENFDQGGIVREHVKWDYELRTGQPVNTVVARALDIAMSEPTGPVYLTLPREVLGDELSDAGPAPKPRKLGSIPAMPALEGIEQAAELLARAERPLIISGRVGRLKGAFGALGALASNHALAVSTISMTSNIASSNPNWIGTAGRDVIGAADVIVCIDSPVPYMPRFTDLAPDVKLIHIAHDPLFKDYPFRGFQMDLAIAGDPVAAIRMLDEAMKTKAKGQETKADRRRANVAELRKNFDDRRAAMLETSRISRPMTSPYIAWALNQVRDKNAIICEELGATFDFLDFEEEGCFISNCSGALGVGLGQSLGAKLAAPDRQVICTLGDGSYMFGCPTAAHFVGRSEKLPTLTMVFNNSQWYAVRSATLGMYPNGLASKMNSLPVVDLAPSPDFEKIVEACGGYGERVEDPEKLIPTLERALRKVADGTPVTLNVITGTRPQG